MYNHFEKCWDFDYVRGIKGNEVENLNRIHPLKQKDIITIVHALKQNPEVDMIVVFGSAVRFDCHSGSDIDLYIEKSGKTRIELPYDDIVSEVDLLYDLSKDSRLFQEIEANGIIVYRR